MVVVLVRCVVFPTNGDTLADGLKGCQVVRRVGGLAKASPDSSLDLYRGERVSRICGSAGEYEHGQVFEVRRKARRFFVKCRDGMLVAQERGFKLRTFVLTESDYAIGMGLDFGTAVNKLYGKMRYDYGKDVGLLWVEHLQGEQVRLNRHVVEWGQEKLDLSAINEYWLKVYGSYVSWRKKTDGGMMVVNAYECAKYLSEYFAGEGFVRARFSHNWVFPGWFDYCRWVRRTYGSFPEIVALAELAELDAYGRLAVPVYREWYESRQEKIKGAIADRILGKSADEIRWLAEYKRRHHGVRPMRLSDGY